MPPQADEAAYVNRHHRHSINAQLVCGPGMQFVDAYVNAPGSVHDARVLRRSPLYTRFQDEGWRPFNREWCVRTQKHGRLQVPYCWAILAMAAHRGS
jgi:hypothetical protein